MAAFGAECDFDFDCGDGLACFDRGIGWVENEFGAADAGTNATGVCTYFGFYVDPLSGELNGTSAWLITALVSMILVGGVFSALGCSDLVRSARTFGRGLQLNAALWTTVITTVGVMCHCLWQISVLASLLDMDGFSVRLPGEEDAEDALKYVKFALVQRPLIFTSVLCAVVACMQVSVVWVDIATRSKRLQNIRTDSSSRCGGFSSTSYAKWVLGFEALYALVMLAVVVTDNLGLSVPASFPFILVILVAFSVGNARMTALLKSGISMAQNSSDQSTAVAASAPALKKNAGNAMGSSSNDISVSIEKAGSFFWTKQSKSNKDRSAAERTRRAMVAIQRCARHVIIACVLLVLSGITYFLLDFKGIISPYGGRALMTPGFSVLALVQMAVNGSLLYLFAAIATYSHRNTGKHISRERLRQRGIRGGVAFTNSEDDEFDTSKGGNTTVRTHNAENSMVMFMASQAAEPATSTHSSSAAV